MAAPYYSLPKPEELLEHFRAVNDAITIPIMLYNYPGRTGVDMKPDFIEHLCELPRVRYVKESTGETARISTLLRCCGETMAKALLASGLIGVFIATRWTFAAEAGGCQAEGGAASSMAATALVTLAGGTLAESVAAASMSLQNMIGLICDPVANRVEVPCLGKNVMAASNALACANMALAGYDPVIPLDEVIETARRVADQMPRELRCTALGGLSITATSLAIEKKLQQRRPACGTCTRNTIPGTAQ